MRHRTRLELALIIGGALLFLFGVERGIQPLIGIGTALVGLAFVIWGTESIIQRRDVQNNEYGEDNYRTYTYTGCVGVIRGGLWVLVGLTIIAGGLIALGGFQGLIAQLIEDRPGIIVVVIGLIPGLWLLPELIGSDQFRQRNIIAKLFGRLFRLVGLLICAAIVTAGLLMLFNPDALDQIIAQLPPDAALFFNAVQGEFFPTEQPPLGG